MADPVSLLVSLVSHAPDKAMLRRTLGSLVAALEPARHAGLLQRVELVLVDNGPGADDHHTLCALKDAFEQAFAQVTLVSGHGNVGYGRGHNLALGGADIDLRLILNPDVLLAPDALVHMLVFMAEKPGVVLLAPDGRNAAGDREYLCKAYPNVAVLAVRGFAPAFVRRLLARQLARYELRALIDREESLSDVPLISGCCMLVREAAFRDVGGFDPGFFMYFEDYDLSLRLGRIGGTAWVPAARITHFGGGASRKGVRHIRWFMQSMARFFNRHGWRWIS